MKLLRFAIAVIFYFAAHSVYADNLGVVTHQFPVADPYWAPITGSFTFPDDPKSALGVPVNLSDLGEADFEIVFTGTEGGMQFTETITVPPSNDIFIQYSGTFLGTFEDLLSGNPIPAYALPSTIQYDLWGLPEGTKCLVDGKRPTKTVPPLARFLAEIGGRGRSRRGSTQGS